MTKKRIDSPPAQNGVSRLVVAKDYFEQSIKERVVIGYELLNRNITTEPELENLQTDYYSWNDYNNEFLRVSFDNPENEYRASYARCTDKYIYTGYSNKAEELKENKGDIKTKILNLERLLAKLSLIKSIIPEQESLLQIDSKNHSNNRKIFIVHGQNVEKKLDLFVTLNALGLEPIILHEQANGGRTIIEKFEEYSNVGYAVVLLTDDDEGKAKKEDVLKSRARQNVILELGFFIGKLGRSRVCALYSDGVDLPNDISGLVYTPLDMAGSWKFSLAKELKAAGYTVDLNQL